MSKEPTHQPFIPTSKSIAEVTVRAIILGLLLAIILAASNAYLGLYAGMTIGASIPAAVISMGILRGLFRTGTILENNMVQTIASTGESLAAGIIFTVPALILTGIWSNIEFWPTTIICMTGGVLGILFMIPLRKSHIVEDETLTFPEGLACAEVLIVGEKKGAGIKHILNGAILGSLFKFFISGISLLKATVEGAWIVGRTGLYMGTDVSAALLGVGIIVGLNVAISVFAGGAIAWCIALPVMGFNNIGTNPLDWFWEAWDSQIRYLGVGAMIVGGVWSLISTRKALLDGLKEALFGYKAGAGKTAKVLRTEENMKRSHIRLLFLITTVVIFFLYVSLIGSVSVSIVSTVSTLVMSFFFVAVASYVCGLVGSSNSPVSGMTICAVLGTAALLLALGMSGEAGIAACLGVAGVVCCATCTSGDIAQDLKTGYILGATPRRQQWMEILGAVVPAFFITPVLILLHNAYGIGGVELKAPQATLFASLAQGLFGQGSIPWNMVFYGCAIGIAIIVVDQVLEAKKSSFRMPVMAVAVGIYLPLTVAVPILLGGIIAALAKTRSESGPAILFSSGLIAGEALMGVLIAALIYFGGNKFPITFLSSDLLTLAVFFVVTGLALKVAQKK